MKQPTPQQLASMLGKLAAGKKKNYSQAERKRRCVRIIALNKSRAKKKEVPAERKT